METWNINGFRMCIELCLTENTNPKKCYIFINKQWSKVKNVQDHIKYIFNIAEDINLFVGEVLLPENETIKLIHVNDVLIVRPRLSKKFSSKYLNWNPVEDDVYQNLNSETRVIKTTGLMPNISDTLSNCLQELRDKREQIAKTKNLDVNPVSSMNDEVDPLFRIPAVKKRKRKHKNKANVEGTRFEEESAQNKSDLITFDSSDSSNKHIHFSDEENKEVLAHSSPKGNGFAEKCRSTLRQLVNKPPIEKIFPRKNDISVDSIAVNSVDNTIESVPANINPNDDKTEPTDSLSTIPQVGDVIAFKKFKLGHDYTPQQSGEIVAEVLAVEGSTGSHVIRMTVIEGEEEFHDPEGKFSMDEKEDMKYKAGKTYVVELHWNEILEPRLKKGL